MNKTYQRKEKLKEIINELMTFINGDGDYYITRVHSALFLSFKTANDLKCAFEFRGKA